MNEKYKLIKREGELDFISTIEESSEVQLEGNRSNKIHDRFVIIDLALH